MTALVIQKGRLLKGTGGGGPPLKLTPQKDQLKHAQKFAIVKRKYS